MQKLIPLSVCPNHCDENFTVNAELYEDMIFEEYGAEVDFSQLEADAFGQPMEWEYFLRKSSLDGCSEWKCQKCGRKPYLVDCISVWIQTENIAGWLLIPTEDDGYVYWTERDDGKDVKSISAAGTLTGVFWYLLQGTKFYPLRGAETIDMYGRFEIPTGWPELRLIMDPACV